eukprot:931785-Pelagomonas_calceolata.AAC.7
MALAWRRLHREDACAATRQIGSQEESHQYIYLITKLGAETLQRTNPPPKWACFSHAPAQAGQNHGQSSLVAGVSPCLLR